MSNLTNKSNLEFDDLVKIIENAKNRAYRKVNEELILMYVEVGKFIYQKLSESKYGDKIVEELVIFFEHNYPDLKGFNRRGLYRMRQFYELYKDDEIVSPLVTQLTWTNHLKIIDREIKKERENPSVGIILCASKDDEVVEFALSRSLSPTMVSKYNLKLIDKKLLQAKLKEYIEISVK